MMLTQLAVFLVIPLLVSFVGAVVVRWVSKLMWASSPRYWNAYLAFFLSCSAGVSSAFAFIPPWVAIALIFLVYSIVVRLPGEDASSTNKTVWLRGALLTVVHLVILFLMVLAFDYLAGLTA